MVNVKENKWYIAAKVKTIQAHPTLVWTLPIKESPRIRRQTYQEQSLDI